MGEHPSTHTPHLANPKSLLFYTICGIFTIGGQTFWMKVRHEV
jgi:hypothetical protein